MQGDDAIRAEDSQDSKVDKKIKSICKRCWGLTSTNVGIVNRPPQSTQQRSPAGVIGPLRKNSESVFWYRSVSQLLGGRNLFSGGKLPHSMGTHDDPSRARAD
jgi:hypothetical protein